MGPTFFSFLKTEFVHDLMSDNMLLPSTKTQPAYKHDHNTYFDLFVSGSPIKHILFAWCYLPWCPQRFRKKEHEQCTMNGMQAWLFRERKVESE